MKKEIASGIESSNLSYSIVLSEDDFCSIYQFKSLESILLRSVPKIDLTASKPISRVESSISRA